MNTPNPSQKSHIAEAASDLLNEGKKWTNEICNEGMNKVNEVEESLKDSSDQLLKKIKANPLASVLIAGGVGFLLSKILSK
jgi:ElaB/YqjD/DUF883 family membrane-anchored ribosome-binding protein